MHDPEKIKLRRVKLIDAGYKAVDELIKVLEAPILKKKGGIDGDDDLAAEKMKTAAQAKRIALDDAFDILSRIQKEEEELDESKSPIKDEKKTVDNFAENRANRR